MGSYIFKYSGIGITFSRISGGIFVNATEMARIFDKDASQWLASDKAISLIDTTANQLLQALKFSTVIQPVQNIGSYTILHSTIAVAFAQWLNPLFGVWCQECINNISIGCFDEPGKLTKNKTMEKSIYYFNEHPMAIYTDENINPYWPAKELCDLLEIKNSRQAVASLDDDEKLMYTLHTSGQNRQVNLVTESGMYSLVIRSNKPEAKAFKKWITSEVLPSIRKNGAYMTKETLEKALTNPDFLIDLATRLKNEQEKNEQLSLENARLKPRAEFVDKVFDSEGLITMSQAAKILKLPYGRNILFKKLREAGIFFKNSNEPKQDLVAKGYFEIKEHIQERGEGKPPRVILQTFPTQKGLGYLAKTLGVVNVPDSKTPIIC